MRNKFRKLKPRRNVRPVPANVTRQVADRRLSVVKAPGLKDGEIWNNQTQIGRSRA